MSDSLLPPNATPQETALEAATARLAALAVPVRDLWNPELCPAAALPWLAWAFSVDDWDPAWTEEQGRAVIAASISVHRAKGTVGALRRALQAAGYGDATVIEQFGRKFHDGTEAHNGVIDHSEPDHWAEYRVILTRPLSLAQAGVVRRILANVTPLRCRLKRLDFAAVAHLHTGATVHDATFSHGAA